MENVCHCKRCPWLFRSRPLLAPTAGLWVNPCFRRLFHRASRAQTQGLRAALCRSRFLPCLTGDAVLSVWTRGPLSESAPPYPRRLRLKRVHLAPSLPWARLPLQQRRGSESLCSQAAGQAVCPPDPGAPRVGVGAPQLAPPDAALELGTLRLGSGLCSGHCECSHGSSSF